MEQNRMIVVATRCTSSVTSAALLTQQLLMQHSMSRGGKEKWGTAAPDT
jgi:hypothetical protein